jgi:acyl-CoA dehydrogenase
MSPADLVVNATRCDTTRDEFRAIVRRFIGDEITPHQAQWRRQRHVDREVWRKAGALGILAPDVPVQYGGTGLPYSFVSAIFEERGAADERSMGLHVHTICAQYIVKHGTEQQRRRYLPRLVSGEMVAAIAMTEPQTGSDLKAIRTEAVRSADGYTLNGTKTFISNIVAADLIIVAARTVSADSAGKISLFLVETSGLPGYRIVRLLDKLGQTGQDTGEIEFSDVQLPADSVLGGIEGQGFRQLMQELPYERMIVAVSAVATMERVLRLAADYVRERQVFGKPLLEFQNTRFKLAEVKATTTVARVFVDHCIERMDRGDMDNTTASIAKLWLSEAEWETVDTCLQLFGGNGYIHDHPIGQILVDARAERIYGGTSEIMKELIARSL